MDCCTDSLGPFCPEDYGCEPTGCQSGICCGVCRFLGDQCFLPGTLIKTSTGSKKIEDVKVDDEVISFKDDKILQSRVNQLFKRGRDYYYSLIAGDYKVEASAEHPFYVGNNQFKEISKLKKGDTVYILQKNSLVVKKITSNTRINKSTPVYNLSVDNTHTYFANDFAVHNKMTCAEAFQKLALSWPSIRRTSETTAIIEWDLYTGPYDGTLSISVYPESVNPGFGCNGCIVNEKNINPKVTSSLEVNSLQSGTLYEMKATYYPIGYVCGGKTTTYLSSCTMTPDPLNLASAGQTGTLITNLNLTVNQKIGITYTSSIPAVATVSNLTAVQLLINSVNSHSTTVTAVSNGTTTVTSLAKFLVIKGEEFHWDQVCNDTAIVNVGAPTATPTPTRTPTPTPTTAPNNPWVKLKNTSYISKNNLNNIVPAVPVAYDGDDTGEPYFIIGSGGVVTPINLGANPGVKADSPEYKATGVSPSFLMTPNAFLSYIKARKQHTVITNPDLSQITGPGIYVYNGSLTLDSSLITNSKVVLIATGNITISGAKFNSSDCLSASKSIAVLSSAGQISFSNTTQCAAGIFIANNISTGTNTALGLKVIGNLVAQTSLANSREWTDLDEPSLFIKFDPTQYIDLLPYLSTANYDWRQIQ